MIARLVCLLRGHIWMRTGVDAGGAGLAPHTILRCARCGRVRRTLEGTHS